MGSLNRDPRRPDLILQPKVAIKRVIGLVAIVAGWLVLALAAIEIFATFYYRPTVEFVEVGGRPVVLPNWTGELVGLAVGAFLTGIGAGLMWSGNRWRRR